MRSVISNKQELCSSISFIDNTDLVGDGPDSQIKIQEMLMKYDNLHSAIGGHIESRKTKYYSWQ